jgi:hypothetical protein
VPHTNRVPSASSPEAQRGHVANTSRIGSNIHSFPPPGAHRLQACANRAVTSGMGRRAITEVCGSGAFAVEQEADAGARHSFPAFPDYSMTFTAFHGPHPIGDDEPSSPGVWESCELPLPELHDELLLPTGTLQWCGVPVDD